jgi:hypothetical protein
MKNKGDKNTYDEIKNKKGTLYSMFYLLCSPQNSSNWHWQLCKLLEVSHLARHGIPVSRCRRAKKEQKQNESLHEWHTAHCLRRPDFTNSFRLLARLDWGTVCRLCCLSACRFVFPKARTFSLISDEGAIPDFPWKDWGKARRSARRSQRWARLNPDPSTLSQRRVARQSVTRSISQSVVRSVSQSVGQTMSRSVSRSVGQSVSRSVSQSAFSTNVISIFGLQCYKGTLWMPLPPLCYL